MHRLWSHHSRTARITEIAGAFDCSEGKLKVPGRRKLLGDIAWRIIGLGLRIWIFLKE